MLTIPALTAIVICSTLACAEPDPVLVVDNQESTQELVQNESQSLLNDARQRKLAGESGFGDHYRRAAWAAFDENPDDLSSSLEILQELLDTPETVLDVFDAYRMIGQMHLDNHQWDLAIDAYIQARLVATTDATLAENHPRVMTSVLQGLSLAHRASGDPASAALIDIELRDHPCTSIQRAAKRGAAISAAENFLRANNQEACSEAWSQAELLFPEKFSGREGVFWRMEQAEALAKFDDDLAAHLELVWNRMDIRDLDSSLHVVIELSGAWLDKTDAPMHKEFAYQVLSEGWESIQQHEAQWIADYQGSQAKIDSLKSMTRMIMADLLATAMDLGLWEDALPVAQAYANRYGETDAHAATWLEMVEHQLP